MAAVKQELQRIAVRVPAKQGILRPSPLPQKTFIHRLSQPFKLKFMALMGLTLLVVSSIGFFSLVHANQVATIHANATANAHATATTAAVNAAITAAVSMAVVNALTNANATATVAGLQNTYYNATRRPPALDDPLRDNSKGYGWEEGTTTPGDTCAFKDGAYHVIKSDINQFQSCTAGPSFSNFIFEVQMKIINGGSGGVIFRENTSNNDFYVFEVGQYGNYQLNLYADSQWYFTIMNSTSPAIKQGLNQTNLIAVIAQGNSIGLFVNHQLIDSVNDNTYSSGRIGVLADPIGGNGYSTEVVFSNAKVWTV